MAVELCKLSDMIGQFIETRELVDTAKLEQMHGVYVEIAKYHGVEGQLALLSAAYDIIQGTLEIGMMETTD